MDQLTIQPEKTELMPGEALRGSLSWSLAKPAGWLELRLFWYTAGKGTMDVVQVDQVRFDAPVAIATEPFSFTLPIGPYSYSGKLVSVIWALEVVAEHGETARAEFVMSPTGREITTSES